MRKITSKLTVIAFLALIAIPLVSLRYNGPWFGAGDIAIRDRAPFPRKFAPGSFNTFSEWFADNVGFRYPLIYTGIQFHVVGLHRSIARYVVFGKDGWMFWTDDRETVPATMADSRGKMQFAEAQVRTIDSELRQARAALNACGIANAVVVAPNKQSIYGEYLLGADTGRIRTRMDNLMAALSPEAKDAIVDARPILRAAKQKYAPLTLFPKTETHWNDFGVFHVYKALMEKFGPSLNVANRELLSLDRYNVENEPHKGGDIAVRVLFSPWRFPDEIVAVQPKPPFVRPPEKFEGRGYYTQSNPLGKGTLVIFGDSFATQLGAFMGQHFAETYRYVGEEYDGAVIARHRADAVVLLTVERYADRLLRPQRNMGQACAGRTAAK
jgi:alginate O-acetyltransferase complex protein AlgJ